MFAEVKKLITSAVDFARDQLSDSLKRSSALLESPEESKRIYGLRRLARSDDTEAVDLTLSIREKDPSILVRSTAEATLVGLATRHPERKAEIALKLMDLVIGDGSSEPSSSSALQHSLKNINKILQGAVLDDKQRDLLGSTIENWWRPRQEATGLVLEMSVEKAAHGDRNAIEAMQAASQKSAEAACDLALILKGVPGEAADALRLLLLKNVEPGPFAQLLFETMAPHATSAPIKVRLTEIQSTWNIRYGGNPIYTADQNILSACLNGSSV